MTKQLRIRIAITLISMFALVGIIGCNDPNEVLGGPGGEGSANEHGSGSEGGEESAVQLAQGDVYDQIRNGARLILAYDAPSETFSGTVRNTTSNVLARVRVEVHLSNGVELGPTTPVDLGPGRIIDVTLPAIGESFATWNAHPEVGESGGESSGEHGSGSESGGG